MNICDFAKGFEVGSGLYAENGFNFTRVSNISECGFIFGVSDKYVSEETYQNFIKYRPNTTPRTLLSNYVLEPSNFTQLSNKPIRILFQSYVLEPSNFTQLSNIMHLKAFCFPVLEPSNFTQLSN